MKPEDDDRLVPVYDAPTEDAGRMVAAFLEHNGIPAFFKVCSGPAFDGVEAIWSGHTSGMVYVLPEAERVAGDLLRDYLASLRDAPPPSEPASS